MYRVGNRFGGEDGVVMKVAEMSDREPIKFERQLRHLQHDFLQADLTRLSQAISADYTS
jgi:hypothetical protein